MAGGIESEGYGCVVNIMGMFVLSAFSGGMGWNPIEYDWSMHVAQVLERPEPFVVAL